jgi:hypothetical protein
VKDRILQARCAESEDDPVLPFDIVDAFPPIEHRAIDAVLAEHQLPASDRDKVLSFARDSVRAFLWGELLAIIAIAKDSRTADEQAIVDAYAELVRRKREIAATFAQEQFNQWQAFPCNYVAPEGFVYDGVNDSRWSIFNPLDPFPSPPSSEEFIAYGTAHAFDKLSTDAEAATIAANTARAIGFGITLAAAGVIGAGVAIGIVFSGAAVAIVAAIAPYAAIPVLVGGGISLLPAGGAGILTGIAALGATVGVVIVAIAIAVLQGIAVFEAAAIPGELQARVDAAQTAPNLQTLTTTVAGQQELYGAFIETTVPEFTNLPPLPAPQATNQQFRVEDESGNLVGIMPFIQLQSHWEPGSLWEARLRGGWFVPKHVTAEGQTLETLSLSLAYVDWENKKKLAWRRGEQQFVHTEVGGEPSGNGFSTDEIRFIDWAGQRLIARLVPANQQPGVLGFVQPAGVVTEGTTLAFGAEGDDPDGDLLAYAWDFGDGNIATTQNVSHAYTDNNTYTVTVTVDDDQEFNNTGSDTFPVEVTNVVPSITSADLTPSAIPEGGSTTLSVSFTDPGLADTHSLEVNWGDVTETSAVTSPVQVNHVYDDTPPTESHTIMATLIDDDGGTASVNQAITVLNVPPSATFNAPSQAINEGNSFIISLTDPSDSSAADTAAGFTFTLACVNTSGFPSEPGGDTALCQYPDNGSFQVSGTIADKDGGANTFTQTVTINNVAPTVSPLSPLSAPEGSEVTVPAAAFSDPALEADDYTCLVDFDGDGTDEQEQPAADEPAVIFPPFPSPGHCPDFAHVYTDNGAFQVRVTVTDDDGGSDSEAVTYTITNVPPTATFTAPSEADEGSDFNISLTDPSDPSSADTAEGFIFDLDCGNPNGSPSGSGGDTAQCQYPDNGSFEVSGTIADKDGGITPYTQTVTITNVPPTATFTVTAEIFQGESSTLAFSDPFDPSPVDTEAGFAYSFDCTDDGNLEVTDGSEALFDCAYPVAGTFTAHGIIKDKDGGVTPFMAAITVLSPQQATTSTIDQVQTLAETGVVNGGQANALTVKLNNAIKQLDKGKSHVATNMLQAFINQVADLMNEGVLTPEDGQVLIDFANRVIVSIAFI